MVPGGSLLTGCHGYPHNQLWLSCGFTFFRHHSPCSYIVDGFNKKKCLIQWQNKGVGIALGACTCQQDECIPSLNFVEVNPYIALNLLLVLNPCSRNVFLVPIAIYMWANVDRFKQQGHQVKVTDVKRCSFCTLQENIQYIVADLFRASKKQITIQAKLSCCYCSGSTMTWLHSTTCKNGVTLIVQYISHKKLQLPYL